MLHSGGPGLPGFGPIHDSSRALLGKLNDSFWSSPAARPEMQCDRSAAHKRRGLQHGGDHAKDRLGIRPIDEVPAFASVCWDCVPVVLTDLSLDNCELNLVPERIYILKVGGTVREMHFDFLYRRTTFRRIF